MSTELHPVAVYGKAVGGDEFKLWARPETALAPGLAGPAGDWLGLFLQGGNRAVCAVQRVAGRWWLFRVEPDPHPDANGRPTGFVMIAGLPDLPATALPGVLLQAVQMPVSRNDPPTAIPDAPLTPTRSPAAAAVALALAVGGFVASVPGFDEAAAVLATGVAVGWVAFLPDRCPPVPASGSGPGLAISKDRTAFPNEAARLTERYDPGAVLALPLGELATAEPVAERRQRLAVAALGDSSAAAGLVVEPAAADWLTATPTGRAVAVAGLSAEAVGWWLTSGRARVDDLEVLAARLGPEHRSAVARLLAGRPGAHADYLRLFPNDATGAVGLLAAADRATWDRLADPTAGPTDSASVDRLFAAVEQTPLVASLGLARLASAVASGSRSAVALFLAALAAEGVPAETGAALLAGGAVPVAGRPPALRPRAEWLAPLRPANWLAAGGSFAEPGWRAWWREGVAVFLRDGRLASAEVIATAARLGDTDLLVAAGAPGSVVRYVGRTGAVPLPPADGPWPDGVNERLAAELADGSLFAHVAAPLGEDGFAWLAARGHEFAPAGAFLAAVRANEPADPGLLLAAVPVLARGVVLQQTAVWGAPWRGPRRAVILAALLDAPSLGPEEAHWLRGLLLRCDPLPPCPRWSVADLDTLLPVLDPVRDVVREMIGRPDRDPHEPTLLVRLLPRLSPAPPPGPFPEVAFAVRPDWVAALASLPGWEGVAGPAATAAALVAAARAARNRWGDELPEPARRAVAILTEGCPE